MSQKYNATTVKLGTIFINNRRSIVILKINGATPHLDQKIYSQEICTENFYIYIEVYMGIVLNQLNMYCKMKKNKGHFC